MDEDIYTVWELPVLTGNISITDVSFTGSKMDSSIAIVGEVSCMCLWMIRPKINNFIYLGSTLSTIANVERLTLILRRSLTMHVFFN